MVICITLSRRQTHEQLISVIIPVCRKQRGYLQLQKRQRVGAHRLTMRSSINSRQSGATVGDNMAAACNEQVNAAVPDIVNVRRTSCLAERARKSLHSSIDNRPVRETVALIQRYHCLAPPTKRPLPCMPPVRLGLGVF